MSKTEALDQTRSIRSSKYTRFTEHSVCRGSFQQSSSVLEGGQFIQRFGITPSNQQFYI